MSLISLCVSLSPAVQSKCQSRGPRGPDVPATREGGLPERRRCRVRPRRRSPDGLARAKRLPRERHQHADQTVGHTPVQRHLMIDSTHRRQHTSYRVLLLRVGRGGGDDGAFGVRAKQ